MEGQVTVQYNDQTMVYDVSADENEVFRFCLAEGQELGGDDYVPEKVIIRKKGKLWVSDVENCPGLTKALVAQIHRFDDDVY